MTRHNAEMLWGWEEILWWHLWCYDLYEAEYAAYYKLYYPGS
jgi:hypothetical protein